jgi:hypothetical protein
VSTFAQRLASAANELVKKLMLFLRRAGAGSLPGRPTRSSQPLTSVRHVGATEGFGAELRSLRNVEVSPELISDVEEELRWGLIWHDFERMMQDEIDKAFAPLLPLDVVDDFDELREMIGLKELVPA